MEINGLVKEIFESVEVSATLKKREVAISTVEQYSQDILVEFTNDKCALLDGLQLGQAVKIHINIRGRMWVDKEGKNKYFNSLLGWRVEKMG